MKNLPWSCASYANICSDNPSPASRELPLHKGALKLLTSVGDGAHDIP